MKSKVTILNNSCSIDEEGNNFITFITFKSIEDPSIETSRSTWFVEGDKDDKMSLYRLTKDFNGAYLV